MPQTPPLVPGGGSGTGVDLPLLRSTRDTFPGAVSFHARTAVVASSLIAKPSNPASSRLTIYSTGPGTPASESFMRARPVFSLPMLVTKKIVLPSGEKRALLHVKEFMLRHAKLLGLDANDSLLIRELRDQELRKLDRLGYKKVPND
jgi:hypothetical protein